MKDAKARPTPRLMPASEGKGPLLQRDYWAVIRDCRLTAAEVAALVCERFAAFAPESVVAFRHADGGNGRLFVGAELEVKIRGTGTAAVRVVHIDANSVTLGTVEGHPERGRITFGAYPDDCGDVVFHIRSRARSSSLLRLAGFLLVGDPMQTNTWTDFIDRLAHSAGDGVVDAIRATTRRVEEEAADRRLETPTFVAQGD